MSTQLTFVRVKYDSAQGNLPLKEHFFNNRIRLLQPIILSKALLTERRSSNFLDCKKQDAIYKWNAYD